MGIATKSTLDRINWPAVNRATRRQVRNREVYCPPISLFRWWARRPHALTRALLDASKIEPEDLVSDPFSGEARSRSRLRQKAIEFMRRT